MRLSARTAAMLGRDSRSSSRFVPAGHSLIPLLGSHQTAQRSTLFCHVCESLLQAVPHHFLSYGGGPTLLPEEPPEGRPGITIQAAANG